MGNTGVCFVILVYTEDNRILDYPKKNYLGIMSVTSSSLPSKLFISTHWEFEKQNEKFLVIS